MTYPHSQKLSDAQNKPPTDAEFHESIDESHLVEDLDEELTDLEKNPPEQVFSNEDNA